MAEKNFQNKLYVSFILKGKYLYPQVVTDLLGIEPSKSFARGDLRSGNRKWPHGYWALESSKYVESIDITNHLAWLMNKLEPVESKLIKLLVENPSFVAKISCFWIMSSDHENFTLGEELLARVGRLKLNIDFDIYSS
jgi:hypothetical protein